MEERILKFIIALRSRGLQISLAESADAYRSVRELGIKDRSLFRISLKSTLIKESGGLQAFDELFPLFFGGSGVQPGADLTEGLSESDARTIADALRAMAEQIRRGLERLLHGDPLSEEELERAGIRAGLPGLSDMRFRAWVTRRMQAAMQFREVQEAVEDLLEALASMGMEQSKIDSLARGMDQNLDRWSDQVRRYAGEKIAEQTPARVPADPIEDLYQRPFTSLSEEEMRLLRQEVKRLAARLKTRIALRQQRSRSGSLDAKATIRANLKHGNVPMVLKRKDKRLQPRLVVICDISTSMRHLSELVLSLIYNLQNLVKKTHAFAFIDHLEYISPAFERRVTEAAVESVLHKMPSGYYNTDLGSSLDGFVQGFLDTLNQRTSLILLGDGRNNYNNPRIDLFCLMTRRVRRTIWINPEDRNLWGTGDSDMLAYAPYCDHILRVNNLSELSRAVDRLLI